MVSTFERTTSPSEEIANQQKVIEGLGDSYTYPLFSGRHAVESQRKSGYRDSARAAREIVDNAYESGAGRIHLVFDRPSEKTRKKGERRSSVSAIAFIDDGPGMIPDMARYALSWGGGTRFESPKGIGRFGFGLPNASINQTTRVEVYSRTDAADPWSVAVLDITPEKLDDDAFKTGMISVDSPRESDLPNFVKRYLDKESWELETGTVVVWVRPDRLTVRSADNLRKLMLEDFGVVYRDLLGECDIVVDGQRVQATDPLFLTPGARLYERADNGGASLEFEKNLFVKHTRDADTGERHVTLLDGPEDYKAAKEDPATIGVGLIEVRISRFPYGFAAENYIDESGIKIDCSKDPSDARFQRLKIRESRRGISYVRSGREIDYIDNLPRTASRKKSELGNWPAQQSYSRHYGIELRFGPELDDVFGIGNDKQTVAPAEDLWRVLTLAKVDAAVRREEQFQREVRKAAQVRADAAKKNKKEEDETVASIAKHAGSLSGSRPVAGKKSTARRSKAKKRAVEKGKKENPAATEDAILKAMQDEAERLPFAIEFFDARGGVFFEPSDGNSMQRVARINRQHPFYETVYSKLMGLPDALPRRAVDLLLLSMASSELDTNDDTSARIETERESRWSPFLKNAYTLLGQIHIGDPDDAQQAEENDHA